MKTLEEQHLDKILADGWVSDKEALTLAWIFGSQSTKFAKGFSDLFKKYGYDVYIEPAVLKFGKKKKIKIPKIDLHLDQKKKFLLIVSPSIVLSALGVLGVV